MKVLFLGYSNSPLIDFLRNQGEDVIIYDEKIGSDFILENKIEFIVSYGYRHLIRKEILDVLPGKVINLHIAYLPFNKGADPNFWSFIDGTEKGVTIHLVDEGLDTGDIILQETVELSNKENLKTTYGILRNAVEKLFVIHWQEIKSQKISSQKQMGVGTYHKGDDKDKFISDIKDKWLDMPISELVEYVSTLRRKI